MTNSVDRYDAMVQDADEPTSRSYCRRRPILPHMCSGSTQLSVSSQRSLTGGCPTCPSPSTVPLLSTDSFCPPLKCQSKKHLPINSLPLDRIPLPSQILAIIPHGAILRRISYGWVVAAVGSGFDDPRVSALDSPPTPVRQRLSILALKDGEGSEKGTAGEGTGGEGPGGEGTEETYRTETLGSSDSRPATTRPPSPPPIMT